MNILGKLSDLFINVATKKVTRFEIIRFHTFNAKHYKVKNQYSDGTWDYLSYTDTHHPHLTDSFGEETTVFISELEAENHINHILARMRFKENNNEVELIKTINVD